MDGKRSKKMPCLGCGKEIIRTGRNKRTSFCDYACKALKRGRMFRMVKYQEKVQKINEDKSSD